MSDAAPPLRGRQAEARRNDERILEAALDVYSRDPHAPMSAVAQRAGVGQASLYRRYPSKDELLGRVAGHAMTRIGDAARAALQEQDAARAVADFLNWYVESGTLRLYALLGTFRGPDHLLDLAHETNLALQRLVERAVRRGVLRREVTGADLTLIAAQIGALPGATEKRASVLRRRYAALAMQALTLTDGPELPGPAPDADELEGPWRRSCDRQ